ncbi:MAG: hypothetical protein KC777_18435 [Cyanobacteria bacterium HKST-UBA02]|nr:hypothetical protein [Cyanobacteria bacterium HKST-UBA02]
MQSKLLTAAIFFTILFLAFNGSSAATAELYQLAPPFHDLPDLFAHLPLRPFVAVPALILFGAFFYRRRKAAKE